MSIYGGISGDRILISKENFNKEKVRKFCEGTAWELEEDWWQEEDGEIGTEPYLKFKWLESFKFDHVRALKNIFNQMKKVNMKLDKYDKLLGEDEISENQVAARFTSTGKYNFRIFYCEIHLNFSIKTKEIDFINDTTVIKYI